MTLKNLLETGQLHEQEADPGEIRRLLRSAAKALDDAGQLNVSEAAEKLRRVLIDWLRENRPDLLEEDGRL